MLKDGKTYFNSKDKANAFNAAFSSISNLDTSNASLPEFIYKRNSRLSTIEFNENDVLDQLKSLDVSKATGPDGVSAKMLKETATAIAPSLTKLLSLSFQIKKVPAQWNKQMFYHCTKRMTDLLFPITDQFHF